eukprot:TRINITY_DN11524_c0_g1_i1.p1 TRINITY_DN11524_c0_g1~~TRINITY_DN11524_c0_g1_i1.p1  ORF type:complete len:373 (-),score=75.19 TRINITY_DN11524_c0_g1_i1:54-1133(-)
MGAGAGHYAAESRSQPVSPALKGLSPDTARRSLHCGDAGGTLMRRSSSQNVKACSTTSRPLPGGPSRQCIETVSNISDRYELGNDVMRSHSRGVQVLFATSLKTGKLVVVKTREKHAFADKIEERRWRARAEIVLSLPQSPHIVKPLEVLEDEHAYYEAMEKVNGQDLRQTLKQMPSLSKDQLREVVRQLLEGVAVMHRAGCIHKDLKLENVKIVDFDTVQSLRPGFGSRSRSVLGTDQYIAPEAYRGNYSAASDIFAVGVIAYKLLTGEYPFDRAIFDDRVGENWIGSPKMHEIQERIKRAVINWQTSVLGTDAMARAFCRSMMALEAVERPSAREALAHPWLLPSNESKQPPKKTRC